jgi:hypothetical protein
MIKPIDILAQKKVKETYRTELRFAINKEFFSAFNTVNPPYQKTASGYRLFLPSGERVEVSEHFKVNVFETDGFKDNSFFGIN